MVKWNKRYTRDELREAVRENTSYRQVLLALGMNEYGSAHSILKKVIEQEGIDTSHFLSQGWRKGNSNPVIAKVPLADILVENSTYTSSNHLRKRLLLEEVFKHECSNCGLRDWLGKPISLELDHINGVKNDNRIENLRIICPNCHAQTTTYRGKNMKSRTV